MSISHLRCENRTCEVQAADAFSKRSCDFKTHLRLQNASATSTSQVRFSYRRCDFKTQMQRSCCVWKMTGCDSSNQTGNSLRGFIRNIINLMVYVFLFLCFPPIYIHIPIYIYVYLIHPFPVVPKRYLLLSRGGHSVRFHTGVCSSGVRTLTLF